MSVNHQTFIHLFFILFLLFLGCSHPKPTWSSPSPVKFASGSKGMVVSAHPIASEIGVSILQQGGNAADAAIAVQLALAVVYPRAGNLGGGGFLVYRDSLGHVSSLDFREKAPGVADRDMYLDSAGQVIPGLSLHGILSAGVPGTVAGLYETYLKLGQLKPWSRLVEPAIALAREGFPISDLEADRLNENRAAFLQYNEYETPFVRKRSWKAGDILIQTQLASTLQRMADYGPDDFYQGLTATRLDSFSKARHGLITKQDLIDYKPVWRDPLKTVWRDCTIYSMGLPSSGGIVLTQILKMIHPKLMDSLGYRNLQNVHLIVEAERRAFADRAAFLGDADHYPVAVDLLLDDIYLNEKMRDFKADSASDSQHAYADPARFSKDHFETTHISIVDKNGNAASVTTTLNNSYGSKVWFPGGGFFLNDEMDDFSIKPGEPNLFGLIGTEANAIAPGKRMLSSMTPTIVEKHGRLWMILGSPGGSTIITSVLQVFLNVEAYGMQIDDAVAATRFHHQWLPDEITYEQGGFSTGLEDSLRLMGYALHPIKAIGAVEAILVDSTGQFQGAADPRGNDHAAGW